MLSEKSQQIVLERDRGDGVLALAERHGISHQRVSAIWGDATELVNRIDLDLMVARKTTEQCALLIPYSESYTTAIDFTLARQAPRDRGMKVDIQTRRASNGLALLLTDATPRRGS